MRQASIALVVVALAGLASCVLPEATLNDTSGRGGTDAGGIAGKGGASGAGGAGNRDATAGSAGSGGFDAGNTGGGVGTDANDSGGGGRSDAAPDVSADINDGAATDSSRDALVDASDDDSSRDALADASDDTIADVSPDAVEDTSDVVIADSAPDAPADADDALVADSAPDVPADSASDAAADAPAFDVGPDTMADAGDAVPTDSAQDTVADAADGGAVSRWPDSPTAFCSNGTTAVACNTLPVGQDGTYAINVPGYSTASGVVTDSVTQLAWQDVPSGAMSYAAASTYCATQTTGGRTWRLPTFLELLSTADYGTYDPASRVGQYGSLTYFWSSDAAFNTANEWVFASSSGSLQPLAKTETFPIVRCVSGAPFVGSFVSQPDGTILDQRTNLYWGPDMGSMTWANAISACENHSQGSFSNFRLPSLKELATLVVPGTSPTYDPVFTDIPAAARYASSTPSAEMITSYWVVQLDSGNFNPLWTISSQTARVRCVR